MQHGSKRQQVNAKHVVEVLTDEGVWAQHGAISPTSQAAAILSSADYHWHHWTTRALAIVISLALHALLVGSALLGTAGRPPIKPLNEGAPANIRNNDASEFVTTLLLLKDHSIPPPDQPADDSAYAATPDAAQLASNNLLLLTLATPKPPQLSGMDGGIDENAPTAEAAGDEAGRAMLFGRYMGQIKARIERAWDRPDTTATQQFDCKVQIKQNAHGEVQEVTLQRCGDDPDWQVSLVQAIQRASPLSAPPEDAVFTELVTMSFEATGIKN
jgi:TonB C terminal